MSESRGDPLPFKSPHRKRKGREYFNGLAKYVGGPTVQWSFGRPAPQTSEFTEDLAKRLANFMGMGDYTDLGVLHDTLPLHYVFILPVRHSLVVYAAYSRLLSPEPARSATYEALNNYIGLGPRPGPGEKPVGYDEQRAFYDQHEVHYYFYYLVSNYYRLFTLTYPFRHLLGLPVKYHWAKSKIAECEPRSEWAAVSSPGNVVVTVGNLLHEYGFPVALQFTRHLYRVHRKVQNLLEVGNLDKVLGLTERYLNVPALLQHLQVTRQSQSSMDTWL